MYSFLKMYSYSYQELREAPKETLNANVVLAVSLCCVAGHAVRISISSPRESRNKVFTVEMLPERETLGCKSRKMNETNKRLRCETENAIITINAALESLFLLLKVIFTSITPHAPVYNRKLTVKACTALPLVLGFVTFFFAKNEEAKWKV